MSIVLVNFLLAIFLLSVVIQLIYFLIFAFGFKRYVMPEKTSAFPVSVVICARNEKENLENLVPSLLSQDHPEFEVIIVNDRSTDTTTDWFRKNFAHHEKLKLIQADHKPEHLDGKKYAITLGVKGARYEHLVFTDADCLPRSNGWLTAMSSGFNPEKTIVLGYSGYKHRKGLLNYFIRFETLWTAMQYLGLALAGFPYMGVGRNMGYSKQLFLEKNGFNGYQDVTGGDDDLFINRNANASNTSVILGSTSAIDSIPKTSVKTFYRQKTRHLSVGKLYSGKTKFVLGLFSASHLLSWALLISLGMLRIELSLVIGSFLIRTFVLNVTFMMACITLGEKFKLAGLLVLECFFVVYYGLVGITALSAKQVRWI